MTLVLDRSMDGNFVHRYILQTAAEILPRRIKRWIFLSSIVGVITQNRSPDVELLDPINKVLRIARGAMGMSLPIYFYEKFWREHLNGVVLLTERSYPVQELPLHELKDKDYWKTALFFTRRTRPCLRYGSEEFMLTDVHDLLTLLAQFPCNRGKCLDCKSCSIDEPMKNCKDLLITLKRNHRQKD